MRKYLHIIVLAAVLVILQAGTALAAQTVHVVKTGDTLWDIANKYGVSVNSLQQNNDLSSDRLQIGMKLIINSTTASRSQTPSRVADSNSIYTVRSGDNLWTIARNFNTTVDQLMSINNLSSDRLTVGDQLYVRAAARTTTTTATPSRAVYPKATPPAPTVKEQPPTTSETNANEAETDLGATICDYGAKFLGTTYRYGGASPSGFDCSGFVGYVFKQHGINLPRTAASIYGVGVPVDKSNLQQGDLVFFKGPGASCINHVGIYTANNQFIHSSSGKVYGVTYSSLDGYYYSQYYAGAKRVINQ
ncbi:MAG TPA: cell wall hydrolase [Syntrophomonas sp.]|mgnify:FL=1|nr:cell wall hydrolase [Syntrophomonas sp.]